jgi:DNA-binding XRE family transcriptional regulator
LGEKNVPIGAQENYLQEMVDQLPVLRTSIRLTQNELAKKIGITRQSMMAIETRKRALQWSTYLALILVFYQYEESKRLIDSLNLFDPDIIRSTL